VGTVPIRVLLWAIAFGVLLAGTASAGKLRVHKMPHSWDELRRAPAAGTAPEPIRRAPSLRAALPPEARHGHLQFGPKLPSLFDRRPLERRTALLRGAPDTVVIKVAVIRVEFATDRAGDRTTGDGRFQRANPDPEKIFIDPPPHDAEYFAAHLEAVNRYWQSMTYGAVHIEGEVFPRGQQFGSYMLSDMEDFGPRSEDELFSIEGLTDYSRQALIAADADSNLVWGNWDVYFVVHAGSDWQNDVLQNTPLDLPTFSIAFSDSDVVVTGEGDTLTTMITYPETSSQDGFNVGLNGGIAHEMGHQLGLLDIYNVETFSPTVAFYDVMDSGNLNSVLVPHPTTGELIEIIGVLPSAIGAWNRWLVTFRFGLDPFEVKGDMPRARLRAIQDQSSSLPGAQQKWYRLSISDTEYFLVENRVDDLDGLDSSGFLNTALDQDDSTGVILGPIKGDSDEISHNYDLLINPGVLIWHVDERQALANLLNGRGLNVDYEKRSVTIEEADGIIDIGSPYSLDFLGTDKETFHADNNANFTPDTRPNSDSNLGSPSNIWITDIGPRGQVIPMDFSFSSKPRGWPARVGPYGSSGLTSTTAADTDGDLEAELCVVGDSSAFVFEYEDRDGDGQVDLSGAWPQPAPGARLRGNAEYTQAIGNLNGSPDLEVVVATDSGTVCCWTSTGTPYGRADSLGVFAEFPLEARPAWSPIPADLDSDGTDELYLVTRDGYLNGWDVSAGLPANLFQPRPLLGALADSADVLLATLAFGDLNSDNVLDGVVTFAWDDSVHVQRFNRDGVRTHRTAQPIDEGISAERVWIGLADLDRSPLNNDLEMFLAVDGGWVTVLDAGGETLPGWPRTVEAPIAGPPAFGDLDADGLLEVALTSGGNAVHAFNYNGTQMPGWPVHPRLADFPGAGTPVPGPAVADVNGDGRQDVLVGFVDFTVRAIDSDGELVDGFPFVTGNALRSTPCILDANGDGRLDLFVQSSDGQAYARILAGQPSNTNPAWGMFGGGPSLHSSFDPARLPAPGLQVGGILRGPVTVYPNPVMKRNDRISIRYTLGTALASATAVEIRLYNLAGEEVHVLEGTAFPNTENVVTLPGDRLASGVYVCSVRARSGANVETHTGKFAVVR
jgi:M6 family metalloprotease-like protein